MERLDPTPKLRRIAEYRMARRTLRDHGTWSLLFAVLSVAAGCLWTPVDWVLTALGVALMATGAWNIRVPRPTSIVADALTLLLVGAYNLVGAVLAVLDGLPPSPIRAFLGALQLVWGVQRLRNLRQFASAFLERPADAEMREIEESLGAIRRAPAGGSGDIIEFAAGLIRQRPWKARLSGEHALFVEVAGLDLLLGTRHTVGMAPRGRARRGAGLEAVLSVGPTRTRVTISADALRAFEQWKAGAPFSRPAAA